MSGPSAISQWKTFTFEHDDSKYRQSGVIYQASEVNMRQIVDGTSNTLLVGERTINPDHYIDGLAGNDDQCMYLGYDIDSVAYTGDVNVIYPPFQDTPGVDLRDHFGSAHPGVLHMAYCDGSVHAISYDVDEATWFALGSRDQALEFDVAVTTRR